MISNEAIAALQALKYLYELRPNQPYNISWNKWALGGFEVFVCGLSIENGLFYACARGNDKDGNGFNVDGPRCNSRHAAVVALLKKVNGDS